MCWYWSRSRSRPPPSAALLSLLAGEEGQAAGLSMSPRPLGGGGDTVGSVRSGGYSFLASGAGGGEADFLGEDDKIGRAHV